MTTVAIYMPQRSTITGDKLVLTKSDDFAVLNGSGDALTEFGTSGWFTCDVAEPWTVRLGAAVVDSGGLVPVSGVLDVGATIVADGAAVLNTAEREAIASIIYDTLTTHPVLEDSYGELFQNIAAIGAATQTKASNILDGVGWLLADATGAIAAPQSATATAILTTFGSTYTVQYAGLTSTGVRTAPTLSKA